VDPCAGLLALWQPPGGDEVRWEIVNGTASNLTLSRLWIDWPSTNAELKKVRLGGSLIWNAGSTAPPTDIESDWKGNRSLPAGTTKGLGLEFQTAAAFGYSLLLEFEPACQLTAGG
jgi:hypothetical protein